VVPWTDVHVRDHRFDKDAMLTAVEKLIQSGTAAGYPLTRLVGHHMDWLFLDKPATYNLVEYEARLNHVLSKYDDPVICNYNPSKFGATVAMDIMRTHPLVIIGGLLRRTRSSFLPSSSSMRCASDGQLKRPRHSGRSKWRQINLQRSSACAQRSGICWHFRHPGDVGGERTVRHRYGSD
jgi:MEDS: MEthanogen/methylotroph, DcmR Sensory domain